MSLAIVVVDMFNHMEKSLDLGMCYYHYGGPMEKHQPGRANPSELKSQEVGIQRVKDLLSFGKSVGFPIYGVQIEENGRVGMFKLRDELAHFVEDDRFINKKEDDSFDGTDLHEKLQDEEISDLVIVGYNLINCYIKTVRTALRLGYRVIDSPEYTFWNTGGEPNGIGDEEIECIGELKRKTEFFDTADELRSSLGPGGYNPGFMRRLNTLIKEQKKKIIKNQ